MKLWLPLLPLAVIAEESGGIDNFLHELETYCEGTYGLPAYRTHRDETRQQFKQRWQHKQGL